LDADGNGDFVSAEDFGVVNFRAVPYSFYSKLSGQTKGLQTATGVVDVSSSAAPLAGQVLTAVDANNATWQNPLGISVGLDTMFWDWSSPISKDSFTDTNGTLLTSHTPDIGPTWSVNLSSESEWTIQSNQLNRSGNIIRHAFMDAGESDVMACAQFTTLENLSAILIRRQDTANYWELYFDYGNQGWQFNKVVAGVDIPIGPTLQGTTGTVCLSANGDVVTARSPHGDTYSVTDTDLNTQTGVGMILDGFGGIPSVVDNWIVVGVNEESVTNLFNIFLNNGNSFGIGAVLGTNDNNSLSFETNNTIRALFDTNGHFTPFLDDTYDLGSNSNRWRDLYLGGTTLHIGTSTTDEGTLSYDTTNNVLNISTDSTTNGDIAFNTNQLFIDKSTGNVGLGLLNPTAKLSVAGSFSGGNNVTSTGNNSFAFGSTYVAGSKDFSFDSGEGYGFNGSARTVAIQNDGKVLIAGTFTEYNGMNVNRIARVNSDGSLDTSFNVGTGANSNINTTSIQSDGKVIIGGDFTSYNGTNRNRIARLNTDGSLDTTFNVGTGVNDSVYTTTIQSDGKVIIGGQFTTYNGTNINRIARLNTDGSLDTSFNVGTGFDNNWVNVVLIQSDGKVVVGGAFTSYNGVNRNRIVRLNADGTFDNTFNIGNGPSSSVRTIAFQSDGKMIIGGDFTSYDSTNINRIARINSNGTLDNTFNVGTGTNLSVKTVVIQSDGKVVIAGSFASYNGTTMNGIARLNIDGSLDNTFEVGVGFVSGEVEVLKLRSDNKIVIGGNFWSYNNIHRQYLALVDIYGNLDQSFYNVGSGVDSQVNDVKQQSDGKILIGGAFTVYNHILRSRIARLNSDGTLDSTFNVGTGTNNTVRTIAVQSDNKIIIGGHFTSYNGTNINRIVRLNIDGSLDTSFTVGSGFDGTVRSVLIQSNGRIIVVGDFSNYNGTGRNRIARLNADGSLDNSFVSGAATVGTIMTVELQLDGKILIGGNFLSYGGTPVNRITRLNSDGTLDSTFNNAGAGADNDVYTIVTQLDGQIIIGGRFANYNGVNKNGIARLNVDGSLDSSFDIGTGFNSYGVETITIQLDGQIIVGGWFTNYNGVDTNKIARLNTNGDLDLTFDMGTGINNYRVGFGGGAVYEVFSYSDRLIIGGTFTSFNDLPTPYMARIHLTTQDTISLSQDNTFMLQFGLSQMKFQEANMLLSGTKVGIGTDVLTSTLTIQSKGSTSSTSALNILNAGGNSMLYINDEGQIGMGVTNPTAKLHIQDDTSNISTNYYGLQLVTNQIVSSPYAHIGLLSQPNYAASSGTQQSIRGIYTSPTNSGTGTSVLSELHGLNSIPNQASVNPLNIVYGLTSTPIKTGTGNLTTAIAMYSRIDNLNATGTISNAYGLFIAPSTKTGAITNEWGLYQEDNSINNYFAGRLGVGTNSPASVLHVQSSGNGTEDRNIRIDYYNNTNSSGAILKLVRYRGNSTTPSAVLSGDTLGATIAYAYDGSAVSTQFAGMIMGADANWSTIDHSSRLTFVTTSGTTMSEKMRITSAGNVGMGTSSPGTHRLSVVGTAGLSTGTAWTNTSDARLKNVENELSGSSLEKLMLLRPVSFRWNSLHNEMFGSTSDKLNLGFVAQEVETVFPQMVTTDENGYKWYNPSGFEAVLTAGIQEQQGDINSIQQEILQIKDSLALLQQTSSVEVELIEESFIGDAQISTYLQGGHMFDRIVVAEDSWFKGRIRVDGYVIFNKDTVGQAIILEGDSVVRVEFEQEYEHPAVIQLTKSGFSSVKYLYVDNVTTTGFDILIDPVQTRDITINWFAFAVHRGNVFLSNGDNYEIGKDEEYWDMKALEEAEQQAEEEVVDEPTLEEEILPEVSPTPTPEPTPEVTPEITPEPTPEATPDPPLFE
jgi:uncharacterized delta-60 repeat protein